MRGYYCSRVWITVLESIPILGRQLLPLLELPAEESQNIFWIPDLPGYQCATVVNEIDRQCRYCITQWNHYPTNHIGKN